MVSAYLDISEINAMQRKPMYMKDWIKVLDGFIKMNRDSTDEVGVAGLSASRRTGNRRPLWGDLECIG